MAVYNMEINDSIYKHMSGTLADSDAEIHAD